MLANLFKLLSWGFIALLIYAAHDTWNGGDFTIIETKSKIENKVNTGGGLIIPTDPRFN